MATASRWPVARVGAAAGAVRGMQCLVRADPDKDRGVKPRAIRRRRQVARAALLRHLARLPAILLHRAAAIRQVVKDIADATAAVEVARVVKVVAWAETGRDVAVATGR